MIFIFYTCSILCYTLYFRCAIQLIVRIFFSFFLLMHEHFCYFYHSMCVVVFFSFLSGFLYKTNWVRASASVCMNQLTGWFYSVIFKFVWLCASNAFYHRSNSCLCLNHLGVSWQAPSNSFFDFLNERMKNKLYRIQNSTSDTCRHFFFVLLNDHHTWVHNFSQSKQEDILHQH